VDKNSLPSSSCRKASIMTVKSSVKPLVVLKTVTGICYSRGQRNQTSGIDTSPPNPLAPSPRIGVVKETDNGPFRIQVCQAQALKGQGGFFEAAVFGPGLFKSRFVENL
jgi:hypothetical protein